MSPRDARTPPPADDTNGPHMDDFEHDADMERLLRQALDSRARDVVPDERRPPPIEWRDAPRARRSWVAPLAIAASVAVVAGGIGVGWAHQRTVTSPLPPATQTAVPTTGTTTATPSPSSTTSPPTTRATSSTSSPTSAPVRSSAPPPAHVVPPVAPTPTGPQTVSAAGATLVAPAGYRIRADTSGTVPAVYGQRWCFDTVGTTDCAFVFVALPTSSTQPLDGDVPGDVGSLDSLCGSASSRGLTLVSFRHSTLGLQAADYRQCSDGSAYDVAQWSVLTPRPFDLVTRVGTPAVRAAMGQVAQTATLPDRSGTTRLYDSGIVRSVRPGAGGASVISLDRVVIGLADAEHVTDDYVLPASVIVFDSARARSLTPGELVGKQVKIHTDGSQITFGDLVDAAGNPI